MTLEDQCCTNLGIICITMKAKICFTLQKKNAVLMEVFSVPLSIDATQTACLMSHITDNFWTTAASQSKKICSTPFSIVLIDDDQTAGDYTVSHHRRFGMDVTFAVWRTAWLIINSYCSGSCTTETYIFPSQPFAPSSSSSIAGAKFMHPTWPRNFQRLAKVRNVVTRREGTAIPDFGSAKGRREKEPHFPNWTAKLWPREEV